MLYWLAIVLAAAIALMLALRWLAHASISDLRQAGRTFIAVFTAIASTGFVFAGRWALALATLAAAFMALRSLVGGGRGADPLSGAAGTEEQSAIRSRLLEMRLDRRTGDLDGIVLAGPSSGRKLSQLSLDELRELLATARLEDPPSLQLLETYLDRSRPGWRANEIGGGRAARDPGGAMDPATAREVLGLGARPTPAEIRAAHRRLMAGLHPDHGGSTWLASQINQARDVLLADQA